MLSLAVFLLAGAFSLLLSASGWVWWGVLGGMVAAYVLICAVYLPAAYRGLCLEVFGENLAINSGVITKNRRELNFESIQYIRVSRGPLHRRFGICTVMVFCAGGRFALPGLSERDCTKLLSLLAAGEDI